MDSSRIGPVLPEGINFEFSLPIYRVSMRKQMSIDQYGAISDGTEKSYVDFNYPHSASSLTDAPGFTQLTEYPAATSGGTAVYSYSAGTGLGTKTFTITRPDSSTVTLTRSNVSGVDFGLLKQTEIKSYDDVPTPNQAAQRRVVHTIIKTGGTRKPLVAVLRIMCGKVRGL
jgi:hypothetical protein